MDKAERKSLIIFSAVVYVLGISMMALGTVNDLNITVSLFNPENTFTRIMESFGQFVYWGIWGIAFSVIWLCRRDLNESLEVIGKLLPFIKPVKNTQSGAYKFFNLVLKVITTVGFYVLAVVGWKKLTENVIKNILEMLGKDNLSQPVYFAINAVIAVISILLLSKLGRDRLKRLEAVMLAGVLLGICFNIVEKCKGITSRVRVREMIAYSNGFLNDKGLSEGKHSPLTSAMASNTDFSAFTPWYKKGDDMGIYNRADSFPSGHTTYSCMLFMLYPFMSAVKRLKGIAPVGLIGALAYVVTMAVTRLVAGAHYLTDVAGALLIGYTLFIIIYSIYTKFTKKGIIG